jgi:hypothetical protein
MRLTNAESSVPTNNTNTVVPIRKLDDDSTDARGAVSG